MNSERFLSVSIAAAVFLLVANAHGQGGNLNFCNDCLPSPPDRLVRDVNGNPLVGTNYVAQLLYGGSPASLLPDTAAPKRFQVSGASNPGTWQGVMKNVPLPPGTTTYLQVRVWDMAAAPNYDQATQNTTGAQYGSSEVYTYVIPQIPCAPPEPTYCTLMLNFRGFTLITNPPPNAALVSFSNADPYTTMADRRVFDGGATTPFVGTNIFAQLLYGSSASSLIPHPQTATFRDVLWTNSLAGTWIGGPRTLTGMSPGLTAILQVRVWDASCGATWETAGLRRGISQTFSYMIPPPGSPPSAYYMENFRSFSPSFLTSPRALAIRESGERVELVYYGTNEVQAADDLAGPWTTLATQPCSFIDTDSDTLPMRFYRLKYGGAYSLNAVGYYRLSPCVGFSMIANQFNDLTGNAITNIIKAPPNLTAIYKFNRTSGAYDSITYVSTGWEGDDLNMTLNPGEGAFLGIASAFTNRFLGNVGNAISGSASAPIQQGWSIVSCPLPQAGPLTGPGGLGFPIQSGDQIYRYNCARGGYIQDLWNGTSWEGDSDGAPPAPNIGESFFFSRTAAAGNWTRTFSIGP
jgi:hypothetical protein